MTDNNALEGTPSVYKLASRAGVPFGLFLSLAALSLLASVKVAELSMFFLPLIVALPVMLFLVMKRLAQRWASMRRVAALWVFGIYTTIFATLICALVSAVYMLAFEPDFLRRYLTSALTTLQSAPEMGEYSAQAAQLKSILSHGQLPSPMELVVSMSWASCFAGAIVSLPLAWAASVLGRRPK